PGGVLDHARVGAITASGFVSAAIYASRLEVVEAPWVSGIPQVGETLAASAPDFGPAAESGSYQWFADGVPVGTDSPEYEVAVSDVGKHLSVTAYGQLTGWSDGIAAS